MAGRNAAAEALGYFDVEALQNAILTFCGDDFDLDAER
jgi:hypothetical protein